MLLKVLVALIISSYSFNSFSEGRHEHDFPKEIMNFHNVMAPLWHMENGEQRMNATCQSVTKMQELARLIENSNALMESLKSVTTKCSTVEDFDAAFSSLHDEFHKLSDSKE